MGSHILTREELTSFHAKLVPEMKGAEEGKYKVGGERIIRAVINYVRALPSVDDYAVITKDVFGQDNDPRTSLLQKSVQYFVQGSKEGHAEKQKKAASPSNKKANASISESMKDSTKEADLIVERIALDLEHLDISNKSVDLVGVVASGADVEASAEGKYPTTEQTLPISIPPVPHEVKKTAGERHR